ncbi:MAG: hypothetical protein NC293_00290 [Roseburia sp.]|nr:hypothetical protein [Roseburia sp.]
MKLEGILINRELSLNELEEMLRKRKNIKRMNNRRGEETALTKAIRGAEKIAEFIQSESNIGGSK